MYIYTSQSFSSSSSSSFNLLLPTPSWLTVKIFSGLLMYVYATMDTGLSCAALSTVRLLGDAVAGEIYYEVRS